MIVPIQSRSLGKRSGSEKGKGMEKIKKLQEEKKEREKSKLERMKKDEDRLKKEKEEFEEMQKRAEEEKLQQQEKRREDLALKMERIKEERRKKMLEGKEYTKKAQQKKPLFQEKEEQYKRDFILPELENVQSELKKIKEERKRNYSFNLLGSAMSKDQFQQHANQYELNKKLLKEKKLREREENAPKISRPYQSKFTQQVLVSEQAEREEKDRRTEEIRRLHDKKSNYAKFVKEMHWPVASRRKHIEVELRKEELRHYSISRKKEDTPELKSYDDVYRSAGHGLASSDNELSNSRRAPRPKLNWKNENNMIPRPPEPRVGQSIDYLGLRRQARTEKDKNASGIEQTARSTVESWGRALRCRSCGRRLE